LRNRAIVMSAIDRPIGDINAQHRKIVNAGIDSFCTKSRRRRYIVAAG
jgi:hypothetical protein